MKSRFLASLFIAAALFATSPCLAQDPHVDPAMPRAAEAAAPQHTEHAVPGHPPTDSHGAHGDPHGGPQPMNWVYGFLGESADSEPSVLWRAPGTPPPFLANIINFAIFAYIIFRFGKKPLKESLEARKKTITRDIESAAKMKDDAAKRLAQYEDKLAHLDEEIERIRSDFRAQGEREKERIIADAKEKRERMLKDAQFLIEQEAKQLRIDLMRDTVGAAVQAAEQILANKITAQDHERTAEQYLNQVAQSRSLAMSKGGSA